MVVEAYRSLDRKRRTTRARCDFGFKLYWFGGASLGEWQWDSFADVFLPELRGEEPENTDYTRFGGSSSLRQYVAAQPVPADQLAALAEPSGKVVEFEADFDAVETQHLRILKGDPSAEG